MDLGDLAIKLIKRAGIFIAVILLFGLAMFVFIKHEAENSGTSPKKKGLVESSVNRGEYVLDYSHVPKTQDARAAGPPVGLLPSQWSEDPKATDGSKDTTTVAKSDRDLIKQTAGKFLREWETFTPSSNLNNYRNRVSQYVQSGYVDDIIDRVDNLAPARICPKDTCNVGSSFDQKNVDHTTNIRDFNGSEAYMTIEAVVKYHDYGNGNLDRTRWLRQYGILMRKVGPDWKIYRVAASTQGNMG